MKKKKPIEAYFCAILLGLMIIFLSMEITARYVFNYSFVWTEEISRFLFIWFVYISASYAVFEKAHITIDSATAFYSKKVKKIVMQIGICIWAVFNLYVTYLSFMYSLEILKSGASSPVTGLLQGIFYFGIPLGFLLMSVRIVLIIIRKEEVESHEVTI